MDYALKNTKIGQRQSGGLIGTIADRLRRNAKYRETYRELSALTDRELADIGVSRTQIADVAAEAAAMI